MMFKYCQGRYEIELPEAPGNTTEAGYIHLVKERPRRTELNALCSEYVIQGLPKGMTIVEHFGGAGLFANIIEKNLEPSKHLLFDIDPDCVAQLKVLYGENAQHGDAKELMGTIPADFIVLDFPIFTAFREPEWTPALERMFKSGPKFVTIADIANQRIGIHRELYTKMFNRPVHDNRDYVTAMSHRWYERYGYSVRRAAYHIFTFMLLTPETPGEIEFKDVRK